MVKPLNVSDMIDDYEPTESILNGDFSCETTEDLYEPTDDELLYPSRHYDWVHDKMPYVEKLKIKVCDNSEICF